MFELTDALLICCEGFANTRPPSKFSIQLFDPFANGAGREVHVFADLARAHALLSEHLGHLQLVGRLKVAQIDNAGHMLHHDQPAQLAALLDGFLAV